MKMQETRIGKCMKGAVLNFKDYGQTLVMFSYLRYLGQTLVAVGDNWPEVFSNQGNAQNVWDHLSQILVS